jgi:hypothetical protein
MRIEQLQETGHGPFDGDGVALVQVPTQLEGLVDGVAEVAFTHLAQPLGQIVHNQAVLVGEKFRTHLGNFPARNVGMKAVEEGGVDHGFRKRGKQMTGLHQGIDRLVDVANKDH